MYILLFYSTTDGLKKKMLVSKENERLYLSTWEYNEARIMSKLAEIVVENGGRVQIPPIFQKFFAFRGTVWGV